MEFITIQDVKDFEQISSTSYDNEIAKLVAGTNEYITTLVSSADKVRFTKSSSDPISFTLDTDVRASDITVHDTGDEVLTGLTGSYGEYTLTNDYVGRFFVDIPDDHSLATSADLKLAALYLVRHLRKGEYKDSLSSGSQSVSTVSMSSNIPKHILALIAPYRPF